MASEWRDVAVEELKAGGESSLATGPFGSSIGSRFFTDSGVPVIRGGNLSEDIGTRLNDDGLVFLSPEKAREFSRSTVREGDLVFTCWGTVNQVGLIDSRAAYGEYVISNKQMKLTPDSTKADSLFLYYLFSSPALQDRIKNQSIGSSVPGFNLGQLRGMRILIPEVKEQRAIAHILGTLDDKIELNRRMNETLEAMSRTLFQSWFVDFDPVRARAEGRNPGLPPHLADLFPDRLVDSELGEIPEGWTVGSILDIAGLLSGGTPSTSIAHYWNGDIPWVSAKDVSSAAGSFLLKTEKTISQDGLDNSNTKILPAHTTIITARGTVGNYCLLGEDMAMNQTNYGLRAKEGVGDYFIFLATATLIEHLQQHSYGTIFDTITTKTFRDTMTVQPPQRMFALFDRIIQPFMARILSSEIESRTLAALRDALLPKLISGELRVKETKRFLSGVI